MDNDLRAQLQVDLRLLKEHIQGPIAAVLITGDITFSGKDDEYTIAYNWIEDICKVTECELTKDVWTIPGNHDFDRDLYGTALPYSAWDQLQRHLPWLGFLDSWDKAERLRRGVAAWFCKEERPLEEFLSLTDDGYAIGKLVRSMRYVDHGLTYLRKESERLSADSDYAKGADGWRLDALREIEKKY